ncbi:MAG TPA: response regulator [Polyangiales bacterium]|nr:response regulator [Polyangiales bacterium]
MRAISVLLVEHAVSDADTLVRELERSEWLVDYAVVDNERRLVEELEARSWHIVISDFAMPTLTAVSALNIVKANDETLPFICVSGTAGEEAAVAVLQAGADDFLVKGKLARLSFAVERALREAAERKARLEAESAMRRSEERLRAVIDSMGDTVFTVSVDLKHDRIFGRRATPSGFAGARLLGRGPVDIWGNGLGAAMQTAMRRALAGERTMHEWSIELSDATLHYQTAYSALKSESGQIIGVVGTERDVTSQKLTDARLLAADRMASVGILASGIIHELKNPLAALAANVELALGEVTALNEVSISSELRGVERVRAELRDAHECSGRIRDVVNDLDVLSRSDVADAMPVDIQAVIEDSLRLTANQTRHSATIVKRYAKVPCVLGNEARLGQLLRNLIINAAQAIAPGNADHNKITIAMSADPGGRVVIEVSDTGVGVDANVARRLFTPYFAVNPVGRGISLELAICQRIVSALGGRISARSTPAEGSTFRVELPSAHTTATQSEPAERPASSDQNHARRGRLLFIDDDSLVLKLLTRLFEAEHEIVATLSASDALTIVAQQRPFDLIFCDVMMPNTSGITFFEKLAQIAPEHSDRVVFMTGGAFNAVAQQFLAQVPNPHVAKPFDLAAIRALVQARVSIRDNALLH